jgi:hypothetical protein
MEQVSQDLSVLYFRFFFLSLASGAASCLQRAKRYSTRWRALA